MAHRDIWPPIGFTVVGFILGALVFAFAAPYLGWLPEAWKEVSDGVLALIAAILLGIISGIYTGIRTLISGRETRRPLMEKRKEAANAIVEYLNYYTLRAENIREHLPTLRRQTDTAIQAGDIPGVRKIVVATFNYPAPQIFLLPQPQSVFSDVDRSTREKLIAMDMTWKIFEQAFDNQALPACDAPERIDLRVAIDHFFTAAQRFSDATLDAGQTFDKWMCDFGVKHWSPATYRRRI